MIEFSKVTWYSEIIAIILAMLIFVLGIYIGTKLDGGLPEAPKDTAELMLPKEDKSAKEIQNFTWHIVLISQDNEIPNSEVYVVINYSDGSSKKDIIDTIAGDCNPEVTEEKLALDSEQITCYYAGLRHKFRVIEDAKTYLVQQETFEEATPENENQPLSVFVTKLIYSKNTN